MRTLDELLGRNAFLARANHNRRAVRIVGAHIDAIIPAHLLKPHPKIGLHILHQVPHMNIAVRVRQSTRHNNFTLFIHFLHHFKKLNQSF